MVDHSHAGFVEERRWPGRPASARIGTHDRWSRRSRPISRIGSIYAMDGSDRMYCHTRLTSITRRSMSGDRGQCCRHPRRRGGPRSGDRQPQRPLSAWLQATASSPSDTSSPTSCSRPTRLCRSMSATRTPSTSRRPNSCRWRRTRCQFSSRHETAVAAGRPVSRDGLPVPARHAEADPVRAERLSVVMRKSGSINRWDLMVLESLVDGRPEGHRHAARGDAASGGKQAVQPGGWVPGALKVSQPGGLSNSPRAAGGVAKAGHSRPSTARPRHWSRSA